MTTGELSMQAYYAARAAEYDRVYQKPERQDDLRRVQRLLPESFEDRRVLEIACGTGYWTQFIAPVAAAMVAIDTSEETLRIAKGRVREDRVRFVVGDAYALPRDHGTFDAAFAGFWFSHVPKSRRREFLGGLRDVLAPGATIVLLDNRYVDGSSTPISDTDGDGNTYQTRRLDDGSTHRVLKNFPSEAELSEMIADVGTSGVLTTFDYFWVYRYATAQ